MKKKSLLFVGNFLSSKPGTRSVGSDLYTRLSMNGWNIIETSHKNNKIKRLADMLFSVIAYNRYYEAAYVDVFSGSALFWAEMVSLSLTILRKPMVLTLQGGRLVEFSQKYPNRVSRLLGRGQIVVTPSKFLQLGLNPYCSNIEYIPNALDISLYPYQNSRNSEPKLIWLRAFHQIYQPEMAVRAFASVKEKFPAATLTMIGPDSKDGTLGHTRQLAEQLGVSSSLNIVGPITKAEVPEYLDRGVIFLNTTRYESFGVSVLEAALVGLPIVSTNVGELPYLWKSGEDALLVAPDDPVTMGQEIIRILTTPELARYLSRNARCKAEQFDWSVILPKWNKLFSELTCA